MGIGLGDPPHFCVITQGLAPCPGDLEKKANTTELQVKPWDHLTEDAGLEEDNKDDGTREESHVLMRSKFYSPRTDPSRPSFCTDLYPRF